MGVRLSLHSEKNVIVIKYLYNKYWICLHNNFKINSLIVYLTLF